jgi:hypothetical protein
VLRLSYVPLFLASFFVVFLLGLQSRNVNQGRYVWAVVTSFWISVSNFTFVRYAATGGLTTFWVSAAAGCLGIASSIWTHQHIIPKIERIFKWQSNH